MLGDRLLLAGGAKLVSALAIGCLVLGALLAVSVTANVLQFRGSARLAADLGARLAASEARGRAEILGCEQINDRVNQTVRLLGQELHACRGEHQRVEQRLAKVVSDRAAQRERAAAAAREREESIRRTYETDAQCRAWGSAPVCRARSDGMLSAAPDGSPG